jgi:hypothetical protein
MTNRFPAFNARRLVASAAAFSFALLVATQAQSAALQIDDPWQTVGDNTGVVDTSPLTANSQNDRWLPDYSRDTELYPRTDLWFENALPAGTVGDFFSLNFRANTNDVFTITLNGPLTDPIIYLGDLDVVGSSVTVDGPDVERLYTNNADSEWAGNVLTTLAGAGEGRTGAFGSVRFLGNFDAGTQFVLSIDYDFDTFSSDNMGIGVGIIPIPAAGWLFMSALGLLGWLRRRRTD